MKYTLVYEEQILVKGEYDPFFDEYELTFDYKEVRETYKHEEMAIERFLFMKEKIKQGYKIFRNPKVIIE